MKLDSQRPLLTPPGEGEAVTDRPERTIRILGVDEAESARGEVSWVAPIARALLKARVGDEVRLTTPRGVEVLEVLEVRYPAPAPETAASAARVKA